jgi:hypothetical protein
MSQTKLSIGVLLDRKYIYNALNSTDHSLLRFKFAEVGPTAQYEPHASPQKSVPEPHQWHAHTGSHAYNFRAYFDTPKQNLCYRIAFALCSMRL